jgi:hypothetical protein
MGVVRFTQSVLGAWYLLPFSSTKRRAADLRLAVSLRLKRIIRQEC